MDEVRAFKITDYPKICEWFKARELPIPSYDWLPDLGLIVDDIACGFMYVADEKLGWIDYFLSNPHTTKDQRAGALDAICENLLKIAKDQGLMAVFCNTHLEANKKLAKKHGLKDLGEHTMFFKGV